MNISLQFLNNENIRNQLNYEYDEKNSRLLENQVSVFSLPLNQLYFFYFNKESNYLFPRYTNSRQSIIINNQSFDLTDIVLQNDVLKKNSQLQIKNQPIESSAILETFIITQTLKNNQSIMQKLNLYDFKPPVNWVLQLHNFTAFLLSLELRDRYNLRMLKTYETTKYNIPSRINLIKTSKKKQTIPNSKPYSLLPNRRTMVNPIRKIQVQMPSKSFFDKVNSFSSPQVGEYGVRQSTNGSTEYHFGGGLFEGMFSSSQSQSQPLYPTSFFKQTQINKSKNKNEAIHSREQKDILNFILGNRIFYIGNYNNNYLFLRCSFKDNDQFCPIQVFIVPFINMENIYYICLDNPLYNYIPDQDIGNQQLLNASQVFFEKFGRLIYENYKIKDTNSPQRQQIIRNKKQGNINKLSTIPALEEKLRKLESYKSMLDSSLSQAKYDFNQETRKGKYKSAIQYQTKYNNLKKEIELKNNEIRDVINTINQLKQQIRS